MPEKGRCGDCACWEEDGDEALWGECFAYPPVFPPRTEQNIRRDVVAPFTHASDGCFHGFMPKEPK